MGLLSKLWGGVRRLIGLIVPFFAKAGDFSRLSPAWRWTLRLLLFVLTLVVLGWLNWVFSLRYVLGKAPPLLQDFFWLPALFLVLSMLVWMVWWLWVLLWPEAEPSPFPRIDEAWDKARQALGEAGIGLTDVPLFLVLGRPQGGEESLFAAAQLQLEVPQAPRDPAAPLHVYANRDAAYVTCAGASLLGRLAAVYAGAGGPAVGGAVEDGPAKVADPFATLEPTGFVKDVQDILDQVAGREATPEEKLRIRRLLAADQGNQSQRRAQAGGALLKESATWLAQLRHLCRLIVRDRRPYCPLNGVLLVLPLAASEGDREADDTATACQRDLSAARDVLGVHCPLFVLVGDLETMKGFGQFIERLQGNQRIQRVGQRFPLMPDLEPKGLPEAIEGTVDWVCQHFFPARVYELLRLEDQPGREHVEEAVEDNGRLYHVLYQLRERSKRLGRIVARAATAVPDGPPLYGGCYVAATGRDPDREQAFVAGVFRRPSEEQNFVSWTAKALSEEDRYRRNLQLGYVGLAGAAVALVLLTAVYFRWPAF
jgi:hypothetical protein